MPEPSRIRPLAPELANQIAAGEVVERPASVLKELLENSLDAGAARIEVEVEGGGATLIRVRDNGGGIHPDDLRLALQPHATSKISSPTELERIASLGFRGEALASIASVSRLTLTTCPGGELGWSFRSGAERPQPAAHPPGTTVEVRDLFYNTPARRKFLRSETTEFFHLEQVFRRLALSRFDVGLTLKRSNHEVLRLRPVPPGDVRRVAQVTGRNFARDALPLEFEAGGLRLWGWLAPPEAARSQTDVQYFYLNGRLVRDRLITLALRQAHRDALPEGRHAAYVLYLELDPAQVDVNVHPTKHEVRFRDTRLIHDFIQSCVREAYPSPSVAATAAPEYRRPLRQPRTEAGVADAPAAFSSRPSAERNKTGSAWKVLTILHGRFLVAEGPGGPVLVDGAAAQEQVIRSRLLHGFSAQPPVSRPLLIPEPLRLDPGQAAVAERDIARFGFEISFAGEEDVLVRRVPTALPKCSLQAVVGSLLALLANHRDVDLPTVAAELAARVRASADMELGPAAAAELLAALAHREGGVEALALPLAVAGLERLFETNHAPRGRMGP